MDSALLARAMRAGKRDPWPASGPHATAPAMWRPRFTLVAFSFTCLALSYMDRWNLSVAAPLLMKEFGWNQTTMGLLQPVFFYGFTATHLPGGWLADRLGRPVVLTGGVLTWALATVGTPFAAGFRSLPAAPPGGGGSARDDLRRHLDHLVRARLAADLPDAGARVVAPWEWPRGGVAESRDGGSGPRGWLDGRRARGSRRGSDARPQARARGRLRGRDRLLPRPAPRGDVGRRPCLSLGRARLLRLRRDDGGGHEPRPGTRPRRASRESPGHGRERRGHGLARPRRADRRPDGRLGPQLLRD